MSLSFEEMVDLMDQCDDLDYELINQKAVSLLPAIGDRTTASDADSESRWLFFDGIFPGKCKMKAQFRMISIFWKTILEATIR